MRNEHKTFQTEFDLCRLILLLFPYSLHQRCLTVWRNLSSSMFWSVPYAKEAIAWGVTYLPTFYFLMELWQKCRDLTLALDHQRNKNAELIQSNIWSSPLSVVNASLHEILQAWEQIWIGEHKDAGPKWLGSVFHTRQTGIEGKMRFSRTYRK